MLFYLSDLALKDYAKYSFFADKCLKKLSEILTCFEDLILHNIPNVKRLKYYQPTVWRYRFDDFRLVFTVTNQNVVLIHRFLPRNIVYEKLPHYLTENSFNQDIIEDININFNQEYQLHNRYFGIPLREFNSDQEIRDYIIQGNYLFSPCLTEEQLEFISNINCYNFKIYQIQGAAGTGKTTLAFQIAIQSLKNRDCHPLIIVPTESLQSFGVKIIESKVRELQENINICTNLFAAENSDITIITVENFFKFASGDKQDCLTKFEANQIINQYINRNLCQSLQGIDLYSLHLGLRQDESYIQTSQGHISLSYENALKELNKYYHKKNLHLAFDFQGRDLISQAKRAFNQRKKVLQKLKNIGQNKPIMFIVDEVQDLYWQQMKLLLYIGRKQEVKKPFVMLGDVNQEIIISGFSWSNFDQNYLQEFLQGEIKEGINISSLLDKHREIHGQEKPLKNFRNTIKIAKAARFILLEAFQDILGEINRHILDPGFAEESCFEEGIAPFLIPVNEDILTQFLEKLVQETVTENNSKFVFILNQESEQYLIIKNILDRYKKQILALNITQAKGQEFDAVIYISLFTFKKSKPTIHELYKFYTALTRARHFSVILLFENEYKWLTAQIGLTKLNKYFTVLENPNLDILIKQISEQGLNIISSQQILQKIALTYGENWSQWLQGKTVNLNIFSDCQEENISFWTLINYLENNAQEIVTLDYDNITDYHLSKLSLNIPSPDNFACVILILKIAKDNQILWQFYQQIFKQLHRYFQKYPENLAIALENVETPIAQCLLLRYASKSWEAAHFAYHHGCDFLIEEIALDLEQRNLFYESARMKYQYLNLKPKENLPFPEVLEQSGDLVDLLLGAILKRLK